MDEKELKLTDLDYATGSHRLQMMKAALPYMKIEEQRSLSLFIKWNELMRVMDFFKDNEDGMMSVCSLDKEQTTPVDMMRAIKPFADPKEQEVIDIVTKFMQSPLAQNHGQGPVTLEQMISMLPPDQQSKLETIQLMMQTMGQM